MAETGHAKNVSNLGTMIAYCVGYGGAYKPSLAAIQIPSLQALLAQAQAALDDVQVKLAPWKNKVADRENIYLGIRSLTTQVLAKRPAETELRPADAEKRPAAAVAVKVFS